MAKTRQQKVDELAQLSELLDNKGVVFFSHQGLPVVAQEELRGVLREQSASMRVAKRKLLLLALEQKGVTVDDSIVDGAVAVAYADDEVVPAKAVKDFAKKYEAVQFFGGVLEEAFVDKAGVERLAALPSKLELQAKLVGSLNAPVSGFVNVLSGNLRGLVNVLSAIKDAKS